jgi:hypothetical protein
MSVTNRSLIWVGLLLLLGCAGPPPRIYILGAPSSPVPGTTSETGRPVVELPTVSVPDYLDTNEIQSRDGQNELKVSATGRWGERLSVGITREMTEALTRSMPGLLVVRSVVSGQPARQVLITVDAFDIMPDRRCVLTARWSIVGPDRHAVEASERATIVTAVSGASDADVVAAMAAAVDQLADRVATSLSRTRLSNAGG